MAEEQEKDVTSELDDKAKGGGVTRHRSHLTKTTEGTAKAEENEK